MKISYSFIFDSGRTEKFDLTFNDTNMTLEPDDKISNEPWMHLEHHQCPNCLLNATSHPLCPVARNLSRVLLRFREDLSYTKVKVLVTTENRNVEKGCSLESGVSSIMGLIMATSDCPDLDHFRPMAFTHLPFANDNETIIRAVSTYLMAQYIRSTMGKSPDWDVKAMAQQYSRVNKMNAAFADRIRSIPGRDANVTAVISLDLFAQIGSFSLPDDWVSLVKGYFKAYLE
jgi:hypothetical protein